MKNLTLKSLKSDLKIDTYTVIDNCIKGETAMTIILFN